MGEVRLSAWVKWESARTGVKPATLRARLLKGSIQGVTRIGKGLNYGTRVRVPLAVVDEIALIDPLAAGQCECGKPSTDAVWGCDECKKINENLNDYHYTYNQRPIGREDDGHRLQGEFGGADEY